MKQFIDAHRDTIGQFIKFGTVGVAGFAVDYALYHFFFDLVDLVRFGKMGSYASALLAFPFTATFTWVGNRFYTFKGKNEGSVQAQWMRFLTVCAIGLVINRGAFILLTATFPLVYEYPVLGLLGGTGAGMFFNFFFSRKLVFK